MLINNITHFEGRKRILECQGRRACAIMGMGLGGKLGENSVSKFKRCRYYCSKKKRHQQHQVLARCPFYLSVRSWSLAKQG